MKIRPKMRKTWGSLRPTSRIHGSGKESYKPKYSKKDRKDRKDYDE